MGCRPCPINIVTIGIIPQPAGSMLLFGCPIDILYYCISKKAFRTQTTRIQVDIKQVTQQKGSLAFSHVSSLLQALTVSLLMASDSLYPITCLISTYILVVWILKASLYNSIYFNKGKSWLKHWRITMLTSLYRFRLWSFMFVFYFSLLTTVYIKQK